MPWYTTADARRDAEKQSASKNRENSVRDNEGPSMNDMEREYRQLCRIDETPGVRGLAQLGRNAIERVAQLEKELAAAVAERDRLRDAMADKIAHESYITGLTAGPGGLVMGMEGDGPRLLSAAFVAMYRDCGAVNYLEMTIQDPANGERFAVTVQRVEGKTPNQLRRDAEAERDHLRACLAAIDAAPTVAWQDVHAPQDLYHGRPQQVDVRPLIARPAKDQP